MTPALIVLAFLSVIWVALQLVGALLRDAERRERDIETRAITHEFDHYVEKTLRDLGRDAG